MTEVIVNPNTSIVEVINEPIVIEIGGFGSSSGGGIGAIANVGAGTGVFKQIASGTAQFKTLLAGSNITLTPAADTITISATNASLAALLTVSNDADGNTITNLGAPSNPTDAARLQDIPTSLAPSGAAGGDLSGTYPNPTLATVIGLTPGAYGSATHYPTLSVDSKGRVTVASQLALPTSLPPSGSAGGDLTGTYPNPTINNTAVTYAKIQNVTANRLLGRVSTTGSVQEIQLGAGLEFDGTTLQVNEFDPLGWLTDGNSVSEVKSIGTLTPFDFPIIANNVEVMRIKASGLVNFTGVSQDDLLTKILTIDSGGDLYWRDVTSITSPALTSFSDSSFEVYNDVDATKIITLNLSGITTGTTRTYTAPNASGVFALTTNVNGVVEMNEINGSLITSQITDAAVTYPKIQTVSANSFLANITGSPTVVQEVATNRIPLFGSAITGTPSATTYLRGDGTWATPAGGGGSSFEDSAFEIYGSSDPTKIAKFEVDGLTTATTRTFTLPDNDGTVALTSDLSGWLTGLLSANDTVDLADYSISFYGNHSVFTDRSLNVNIGWDNFSSEQQFSVSTIGTLSNNFLNLNSSQFEIGSFGSSNTLTLNTSAGDLLINSTVISTSDFISLGFSGDEITISGSTGYGGLKYESDNSANYTDRSVVDKGYVDSQVSIKITDPMTTIGDIVIRNNSNITDRLGIGSPGTILRAGASVPAYSTFTIPNTISALSTFVSNTANVLTEVTPAAGQSIRVNAGNTAWEAFSPLQQGTNALTGSLAFNAATGSAQNITLDVSGIGNTGDINLFGNEDILFSAPRITVDGQLLLDPSGSGGSSFRLPHGTAPSSPVDGDIWTTTTSMYVRINGVTVDLGAGGGSSVLSDITAATGANTINSGANHQIWDWNSLTSGTGISFRSSSTGAASNTLKVVHIEKSGANATSSQTTTALNVSNTSTGTSSTNIALVATASGGTDNIAGLFTGRLVSNGSGSETIFLNASSSSTGYIDMLSSSIRRNRFLWSSTQPGYFETGGIGIGAAATSGSGLSVNGNIVLQGSNRYINFTSVNGSSGYGFRDNAGTMEFKNSGGSWTAFSGGGGIGGSTGSVDNALLRADGTGGSTAQSSSVIISDTADIDLGVSGTSGTSRILQTVGSESVIDQIIRPKGSSGRVLISTSDATNNIELIHNTVQSTIRGGNSSFAFEITGKTLTTKGSDLQLRGGNGNTSSDNGGHVFIIGGAPNGVGSGIEGNVGISVTTVSNWQSMERGLFFGNATTAPTGNPADGVFEYSTDVEGTAEKYIRTESGAVVCASGLLEPIEVSGTTLTLSEDHRGKFLYFTNAAGCTVTVPTTLKKGFSCIMMQDHATGTISTTGATVNGKTSTTAQYDKIVLVHYKDTDVYYGA